MKPKGLGELCAATSDLANQTGIEKNTKKKQKKKNKTKKKKKKKNKTKNRSYDHPQAELDILLFQKTYKCAIETRGPKSLMIIWSKMNEPAFPHCKSMGVFYTSRAANSVVSGPIWPKFELVRDVMHVLVTCKYKNDRIKSKRKKVETPFSPL